MKGRETHMESNIFDVITDYSVNEGMDGILRKNEEYIKMQQKMDKQIERFDSLNLTKEQRLVVDRLVSSHIESGALYGKMTYRKGFRDCASLLQAMGLIKAS